MTNPQSGDATLGDGEAQHRLRLSLAALAEIEAALEVSELDALAARLGRLSASDLTAVLTALLRAGGADAPEAIAGAAEPRAAAAAVTACFTRNLS